MTENTKEIINLNQTLESFKEEHGKASLIEAIKQGEHDFVIDLCETSDFNYEDEGGLTALFHSIIKRLDQLTKILIDSGKCNLDHITKDGSTLTYYSVRTQNIESLKYLIEKKKFSNIPNLYGVTPFALSCILKNLEICNILLDNGCQVQSIDFLGRTPLSICIKNSFDDMTDKILDLTKNYTDTLSRDGFSATHYFAEKNQLNRLKTLLEKGASLFFIGNEDRTLLHVAILGKAIQVIEFLMKRYQLFEGLLDSDLRAPSKLINEKTDPIIYYIFNRHAIDKYIEEGNKKKRKLELEKE